jgi:vancomycin resistance protein YoaR
MTPITVVIDGSEFQLVPAEIDFSIDEEAMLSEAMAVGRQGGLPGQFRWWLGSLLGGDDSVSLVTGFSRASLDEVLERWETESIADPPSEGGVIFDGTSVVPEYPRSGTGIDADEAAELVAAALVDLERAPIEVPTRLIVPTLTDAEVDAAVAEAEALVGTQVTLSRLSPQVRVEFSPELLGSALRSRVVGPSDDPRIEISLDPDTLLTYLIEVRDQVESAPVNAQIVATPEETIRIIPSRPGLVIDAERLVPTLMEAATAPTRTASLPMKEGSRPTFTTEDAEALNVNHLLYRATTFFPAGGPEKNLNRINNIQLMAAEVDGVLVMPGETFSVNEHVGQRTLEKGYLPAGAIIGDNVYCCDKPANIGGGVSQFATTLYNAVFFSGLEDVEHTPHTLYFSRYPEGREATLGYPSPDVVFRNNTDAAVLIDTETTDSSVTVRFYGDNGGLEVEAGLSERRDPTEPFETYEADPSLPPGEEDIIEDGSGGWTVTVFRYITYPDGTETEESWVWRYRPFPTVIAVHPCALPENHPDFEPSCPAVVPNVVGKGSGNAMQALANSGFNAAVVDTFSCDPATQRNLVISQDPAADSLVDPGTMVTITVCRQEGGDGDNGGDGG